MSSMSTQAVALLLGRDERADDVVTRVAPTGLEQCVTPEEELGDGTLDLRQLGHQAGAVELLLDPCRPAVQPVGVLDRSAHHRRDRQRGVGLRQRLDGVALAVEPGPQLLEKSAHHRSPAVGRPRGEERVHQPAQTGVHLAVDVQHVAVDLLALRLRRSSWSRAVA